MIDYPLTELEIESPEGSFWGRTRKIKVVGIKVSDVEMIQRVSGLMGIEYSHRYREGDRWRSCPACRHLSEGPVKGLALSPDEIVRGCPLYGTYRIELEVSAPAAT